MFQNASGGLTITEVGNSGSHVSQSGGQSSVPPVVPSSQPPNNTTPSVTNNVSNKPGAGPTSLVPGLPPTKPLPVVPHQDQGTHVTS